jgi:hypothetical protein
VQPSLFDTAHKEVFSPAMYNKTSKLSLGEQLYTARGHQSVAVGGFISGKVGLQ